MVGEVCPKGLREIFRKEETDELGFESRVGVF